MGAAENLAADPDFAKLHAADPKGAEGLMVEALQRDSEGPYARYTGKPDLPLEETATAPRNIIMTAGSLALPAAWMGQAAKAGVGTLGQLGAAAGANEALTLADRATQPGATLKATLTPGLSDVAAVATPFVAQAVAHPVSTFKSAIAPFARSSQVGKEAANSVVQAQNAKLQADYDLSVASQDKAKAIAGADYESQIASWNTLKAAQTEAKRQAAEDLRGFATTLKSRNVTDAAQWAANRPGVPTWDEVHNTYAAGDTLAQAHGAPISLPEVTAVKKTILTQADVIAKQPGGAPKAAALRTLATSGQEDGISLTDANEIIKGLHQDIAALRAQPSLYAKTEANAYSKIVDAYETGMTRLEQDGTIPIAVRDTIKAGNTLYLKKRTDEEMTQFMTKDIVTPGPSGEPQLDPRVGLKLLDSKAKERMTGYMKKIIPPDGNGQNLYDMTKETLTKMASTGQAEWEAQRLLTKTGGMKLPEKPLNPVASPQYLPSGVPSGSLQKDLPYPKPTGGMLAELGQVGMRGIGAGIGFAAGGGPMNPYRSGALGLTGFVEAPAVFAKLMQTGWGQRTLLALVNHQGRTISPALVGLATAAVRAGESEQTPSPPSSVPAQ